MDLMTAPHPDHFHILRKIKDTLFQSKGMKDIFWRIGACVSEEEEADCWVFEVP
jgi:hypothetical protein